MPSRRPRGAGWRLLIGVALLIATSVTATMSASARDVWTPPEFWQATQLRDHALVGRVYDVASGTFITPDVLIARLARADHVLLGEIHDNPEHHALQGYVLAHLVAQGRRPVVVLEMLRAEQGPLADLLNDAGGDPRAWREAIAALEAWWRTSGWPALESYAHIFGVAHGKGLRIAAGEPIPPPPDSVDDLLAQAPLSAAHAKSLNGELVTSHCGVLPETVVPKIAVAQRKRDIKLARAMIAAARVGGDGTVLIAGSGHARKDRGVPHYLRHLKASSLTLNFREVTAGTVEARDLIEPGEADYVWFTPRQARVDPCIALRKRFGASAE